jgi:hypothetical protein
MEFSNPFSFIINSSAKFPQVQIPRGWTTEGPEFESRYGQEFSLLHVVQAGSGVHRTSYSMDTVGIFPGSKAAGA